MHDIYRERETVFAATMTDRADWERATRRQRQLAVAADAELHRRHPAQPWPPLRSAEPELAPAAQPGDQAASPDDDMEQTSLEIPAEDPDYENHGPAFPSWAGPQPDAILQPPKPQIQPSLRILERTADRDPELEAAD
jgi:hypothetical protein